MLRISGGGDTTRNDYWLVDAEVVWCVQALVTTEVAVQEHDAWLHHVLRQLLQLVAGACPAGRTHALHVLRALVRHAALGARAAPLLQDVLCAALRAFDARSWPVTIPHTCTYCA